MRLLKFHTVQYIKAWLLTSNHVKRGNSHKELRMTVLTHE